MFSMYLVALYFYDYPAIAGYLFEASVENLGFLNNIIK